MVSMRKISAVKKNLVAVSVLLASILFTSALVGSAKIQPAAAADVVIEYKKTFGSSCITGSAFVPDVLTIKAGTTVTWKNVCDIPMILTIWGLYDPTMVNSDMIMPGEKFTYKFDKSDVYSYRNNNGGKQGKVIVEPSSTSSSDSTTTKDQTVSVKMGFGAAEKKNKAFSPSPLKVKVGTTVTWKNDDKMSHQPVSGKGWLDKKSGKVFESKSLAAKESFSFKFDKKGTFDYYCKIHPTMVGKVTVR